MSAEANDDDLDLFGEDDEPTENVIRAPQDDDQQMDDAPSRNDDDDENAGNMDRFSPGPSKKHQADLFGGDDDDQSEAPQSPREPTPPQEDRTEEYRLPDTGSIKQEGAELFFSRLSNLIDVDYKPFDEIQYATDNPMPTIDLDDPSQRHKNASQLRVKVLSTMRWRDEKDENGNLLRRESNTRLIKWKDGSYSLKIGDEMFDVMVNPLEKAQQYMASPIPTDALFRNRARFLKEMRFKPYGIHQRAHQFLAQELVAQQVKKSKVKTLAHHEMPKERGPSLQAQDNAKYKKQLESGRKRVTRRSRNSLSGDTVLSDSDDDVDDLRYRRGNRDIASRFESVRDEEYEQDGFVVNDSDDEVKGEDDEEEEEEEDDGDDDEDEAREKRLREVKASAPEPRKRKEAVDEDGPSSASAGKIKKRRVVMEDDDD
ncbi:hypothetical protein SmJEL517_g04778 [Synchytrium microbalum]|uniref:Leo1-like protein n=1 Tax=Synchytrium microbalum TaxID=1806994 RepID=A0A507C3B2_9FUNG|nr:uncharacterized protein SmJEL517_g04778 [Synchytrium microbalum]TPX32035.1 hypothetical protein SmJEL517_g04778 [Synchytrium microbalum]